MRPRNVPARGRRRSERSHRAIVAATQELLVERGIPGADDRGHRRAGGRRQADDLPLVAFAGGARRSRRTSRGSDVVLATARSRRPVREDVRELLGWLIAVLPEPTGGRVVAGLVADLQHDPDLAEGFHRDVVPARRGAMLEALERGRERGEIRADADLELAVDALHGAVFYRLLLSGEPLDAAFVEQLADQVLDGLAAHHSH